MKSSNLAPHERDALAYLKDAEVRAGQIPGLPDSDDWNPGSVTVIGAGTMGSGIAMALADKGVPVVLIDRRREDVDRGIRRITANYSSSVKRGRLTPPDAEARIGLITPSTDITDVAGSGLVIEAVFEEMAVKRDVFAMLDKCADPDTVLGTNTSSLDIDEIASATTRPDAVIGAHFFSPAHVMRLLEVVPGTNTSPTTLSRLMSLGRRIGKVPVRAGNQYGFIGNAMMLDYLRQALFLIEEGALPADVDRVLTEFGFAMGPFTMTDMAGHDLAVESKRAALTTRPTDRRYSDLELFLVDSGRLGQKSGAGWYRYAEGDRTPHPDPEFNAELVAYSARRGIERREISDEEILQRCVFTLVNRAASLLADGVADKPSDIDVVYTTGYGFPATKGGPLYWADSIGLDAILEKIEFFEQRDNFWWTPAPLLVDLVENSKTFTGTFRS